MPKQVDHEQRRQELARAVWRVIVRAGLDRASLRLVSAESGWSIGAMRHYFSTRDELLTFAMRHMADRVQTRMAETATSDPIERLRTAAWEILPLSPITVSEARVWLYYIARAAVDAKLRPVVEEQWQALNEYLAELFQVAHSRGQLAESVDPHQVTLEYHALIDGLCVAGLTTPSLVDPASIRATIDGYLHEISSQ